MNVTQYLKAMKDRQITLQQYEEAKEEQQMLRGKQQIKTNTEEFEENNEQIFSSFGNNVLNEQIFVPLKSVVFYSDMQCNALIAAFEGVIRNYYKNSITEVIIEFSKSLLISSLEFSKTTRNRMIQELLLAIYLLSIKYQLNFKYIFIEIMYGCYSVKSKNGTYFYGMNWSFSAFTKICEENNIDDYSVVEARKVVTEIWKENFCLFMSNAKEAADIKILKQADDTWGYNNKWKRVICEYFKRLFNNRIAKAFVGLEYLIVKDKLNRYVKVYENECVPETSFVGFANMIKEYYPDLLPNIYFFALFESIYLKDKVSTNFEDLLQRMADYAKYQNVKFDLNLHWKAIVNGIMAYNCGENLNFAVHILSEYFYVPAEKINDYIARQTMVLLYGDAKYGYDSDVQADDWVAVIMFEKMNNFERLIMLRRLLSNSTVFEVLVNEKSSIIQNFSDLAYEEY